MTTWRRIVLSRWEGLLHVQRARWLLAGLGILLVLYLLIARKPWTVSIDPAKPPKLSQYVAIYFWLAALINLVLTACLAASAKWWARPARASPPPAASSFRGFWLLIAGAMAITAITGWPRLGQSLWHDEAYPVRRTIVGTYKPQPDGSLRLDPVSWQETLFYFKKPNHILHSVICRTLNDIWRFMARPKGLQFSETVLRLPSYVAAIASIATIALLLRKLGFPSAGVIAAYLFALHPWHLRYAAEARAYAIVMALVPLVIYLLLLAIERRHWKWWAAFALTEFLLMYAYPTCIYVLAVLNLVGPFAIYWSAGAPRDRLDLSLRWLVANIAAGMAFLQMVLPAIPQFLEYIGETEGLGEVDYTWTQNFMAHLISGIPWSYTRSYETNYLELFPWAVNHPGWAVLALLLASGFFCLGVRRLLAADRMRALMLLPMILPAVLCYIEMRARSGHMYEWYVIFVLPGVVALTGLGIDEILSMARSRAGRATAAALVLLILGAYAGWTAPQRAFLMKHSIQPVRESVLLTRPSLDPLDPAQKDVLTATFFGEAYPYDPNMIIFRTMPSLARLVRRADAEGKPLYINLGYLVTVEGEHAQKYELLKTSGLFDDLGILRGYENMLSRHVFRYRPGSADSFNFDALPEDRGSPGHNED